MIEKRLSLGSTECERTAALRTRGQTSELRGCAAAMLGDGAVGTRKMDEELVQNLQGFGETSSRMHS